SPHRSLRKWPGRAPRCWSFWWAAGSPRAPVLLAVPPRLQHPRRGDLFVSRVDDRALILQGYPYSDTSRILKLFCERYGLQTVIAKGAMRPRRRFGGILEPFTEGRVQFHLQDGREMHTL